MKKILSFLLLCLTGIAAWAQNPVTNVNATFSNTGTSWAGVNITVAATDASNAAVSGVTATVTGNTAPKTVSQPGTNCIVINKNSNAMSNEPLNFTISGLPAGSKFNRINLPMYAITGGGAFQQTAGQSDVTFKVTVIEGGNTLYENTITDFNVPQIQKGQLNDLLVYECAEDIVTSGGDLQVNFSISKGTVNNGMCMAFQSLKLSYLSEAEYTVNVSGATGGGVTYDGHTYNNGEKITATGLSETDLTATPVEGYVPTITIDDLTVNVVYTNILNASINYTPLTTDCWSSWTGEVPAGISALDATNYTATNLRVIAKTCVVAEAGTLQSTFVYTSGNNRIDIVGVDVVDASGNVVSADYHNGFSGGNKQNHVYTVTIPAGTYTVRYITTAQSSDGRNTNTNGHIDNVFTPSVTKTYTVTVTGTTAGGVVYDGTTYGNGETFTATGLNATQLSAVPVGGYTSSVSLDDTNITVAYTAISYTFETSSLPVAGEWQNGTKFYTIKEKRVGYLCANQLPDIRTQTSAPTTDDGKWAVIANGSYFQFMNKASKEVLTFAGAANDALATTTDDLTDPYSLIDVVTYLNASFESGYECFKIAGAEAYPNDKGIGLAVWNSNQALWGWGGSQANPGNGDDGSKFQFSLVETLGETNWDGLEAAINSAYEYPVGDGLGEFSWMVMDVAQNDFWEPTLEYYSGILSEKTATADEVDEYIGYVQDMIAALQINQPKPGTFLRVIGANSLNYIAGDNSVSNGHAAMTDAYDATSILCYTEDGELIGYKSGLGFTGTYSRASVGGTFEHHTFSASPYGEKGAYTIQSDFSGSKVLYDGGTDVNRNSAANSVNCAWYLEEITELPVEFKEAGKDENDKYYSTLYSPVAVELHPDVTAYYATSDESSFLSVEPLESDVVPANTPVILEADEAGTKAFLLASENEDDPLTGNLLHGTVYTKESTSSQDYVLSIVDGKVGFYKYVGSSLQGFKAYFNPTENGSASSEIQGFTLDFGGQTVGVNSVISATNLKAGYDIQGRRINKVQKGINILGGKKIIK